jgi:geranylgeranyl diphosphate synthase type I
MNKSLYSFSEYLNHKLKFFFNNNTFKENRGHFFSCAFNTPLWIEVKKLTLRGGKRIRPSLIACGAELFKENSAFSSNVENAALAMEMLHTYFLIHDDIMDNDAVRRDGPSVHTVFTSEYKDSGIGVNMGILAGDLACSLHEYFISKLESRTGRNAASLFAQMHSEVIEGQMLDILVTDDPYEIVIKKTAAYTTKGPLLIGSALGGASSEQMAEVEQFATPLGIAFQFQDDLLGIFGNEAKTGKSVGSDIKNGKQTQLIKFTEQMASSSDWKKFKNILGNRDATDNQIQKAMDIITKCGAKDRLQKDLMLLIEEAEKIIISQPYLDSGKQFLLKFIKKLQARDM